MNLNYIQESNLLPSNFPLILLCKFSLTIL